MNALIHESSPYLLQHAHNPVNWYPWKPEVLEKARQENKLILVSIGYSACHWCHVMERECFEDETTARIMNDHFINIKVDREERPDIDQVYMSAVQLMTGRGGWPLNCFALPDSRPIYGGTYFPKEQWQHILLQLVDLYQSDPAKALEYAERLTHGMQHMEVLPVNDKPLAFDRDALRKMIYHWVESFDKVEGGTNRAPKFPLPNNYEFLLYYAFLEKDEQVMEQVKLTLRKMAFGGLYDQVGGGFTRYSTDYEWKVPHFEKMLYDNGQLMSLYTAAYQCTKEPLYKEIIEQSLQFVARELTSPEGGFYSALDADSEGEEGKFYTWSKGELEQLLGADFVFAADYYNVNEIGWWEHDQYILLRKDSDDVIAARHQLTPDQFRDKVKMLNATLLKKRESRIRPGLDDKILTSWNALMLKGYANAYRVLQEDAYLQVALTNADFIRSKLYIHGKGLFHSYKNGKASIDGFLEDYALLADALIALYQVSFQEEWLQFAKALTEYAIQHFSHKENSLFYFTSDLSDPLIARKMENSDNVIPASNSVMAHNLFMLGHYFALEDWIERSKKMLHTLEYNLMEYGPGYSNWAILFLWQLHPFHEVAIAGADAIIKNKELNHYFWPNKLVAGAIGESAIPLLQQRFEENKTWIYVCENKTCKRPVDSVKELF